LARFLSFMAFYSLICLISSKFRQFLRKSSKDLPESGVRRISEIQIKHDKNKEGSPGQIEKDYLEVFRNKLKKKEVERKSTASNYKSQLELEEEKQKRLMIPVIKAITQLAKQLEKKKFEVLLIDEKDVLIKAQWDVSSDKVVYLSLIINYEPDSERYEVNIFENVLGGPGDIWNEYSDSFSDVDLLIDYVMDYLSGFIAKYHR